MAILYLTVIGVVLVRSMCSQKLRENTVLRGAELITPNMVKIALFHWSQREIEMTAPLISEKELQETAFAIAILHGWLVGWTRDRRKSEPGFPDFCLAHMGTKRVVFIEFKTEKGKLSAGHMNTRGTRWLPGQQQWAEALGTCPGVEYYLIRPSDLDSGKLEEILRDRL